MNHTHTNTTQLLSPSTYTEMSRFDPIGAGFMLSIDDDGYFTVSSDPRVRTCFVRGAGMGGWVLVYTLPGARLP